MDSVMIKIFEMIYYNPGINFQRLAKEFDLNRNQIQYRLKKLNAVLQENGLASIEWDDQRLFTKLDFQEKQEFLKSVSSSIQLRSTERYHYILLKLILQDKQTLLRLSHSFDVSKNTVLTDMKEVEKILVNKDLEIYFDRQQGYQVRGDELSIRKLWFNLLKPELEKEYGITLLKMLLDIDLEMLAIIHEKIEHLEEKLNLYFSEAKIDYLSLTIYLSITRAEKGNNLSKRLLAHYAAMIDEMTYSVVEEVFKPLYKKVENNVIEELQFITMNSLSINIVKKFNFRESKPLTAAIDQAIENFERFSITEFEKKEELRDMLCQHVIPASYRIYFGAPDKTSVTASIKEKYAHYYSMVKKSIVPLEKELGVTFQEDELAYILIIFLSFLKEKTINTEKKRAVVVCMNGLSISKLLLENLRELFPEIEFQGYLSCREYYETMPEVELIFSTVALDTETPIFIIRQFLTDEEKRTLKRNVELHVLGHTESSLPTVDNAGLSDNLMTVIEKYAEIKSGKKLKLELEQTVNTFLGAGTILEVKSMEKKSQTLEQLLPQNHIQIYDETLNFAEAIRLTAKPLLMKGYIEARYVDKIIDTYDPEYPYFVIAPELALPHAGPEDGVSRLGMSLLRLAAPVSFSTDLAVQILVMVAPENKKSHLNAVTELYTLAHRKEFIHGILAAKYEKEIYQLIREHE